MIVLYHCWFSNAPNILFWKNLKHPVIVERILQQAPSCMPNYTYFITHLSLSLSYFFFFFRKIGEKSDYSWTYLQMIQEENSMQVENKREWNKFEKECTFGEFEQKMYENSLCHYNFSLNLNHVKMFFFNWDYKKDVINKIRIVSVYQRTTASQIKGFFVALYYKWLGFCYGLIRKMMCLS